MAVLAWFTMKGASPVAMQIFDVVAYDNAARALILHYISHASIQVSHVQSFILMSSFLCSVNCLPQAWLLVGQAVRTAQDLGLHVSTAHVSYPR